MRFLVAEDDYASRYFLVKILEKNGKCDTAVDGLEAINAYLKAEKEKEPYDLICLDIMMPKLDGLKALKVIKDIENQKGVEEKKKVKMIITTALNDNQSVMTAEELGCEAFIWKPIDTEKFILILKKLKIIE
ncbi:response regulator [Clostridium sp. ZBS15]|uniref:response regulator n=1 Tax=Clostridium sp. ZBS15 TaxID=2949969 RepID=UPI00207965A8|nr:response regulator [Clostridium sp. ZBS15]